MCRLLGNEGVGCGSRLLRRAIGGEGPRGCEMGRVKRHPLFCLLIVICVGLISVEICAIYQLPFSTFYFPSSLFLDPVCLPFLRPFFLAPTLKSGLTLSFVFVFAYLLPHSPPTFFRYGDRRTWLVTNPHSLRLKAHICVFFQLDHACPLAFFSSLSRPP